MIIRPYFALLLGAAVLSACGGGGHSVLPGTGSQSAARSATGMTAGAGATPGPALTLAAIAGVNVNTSAPLAVFGLSSNTACFGNDPAARPRGEDRRGRRDGAVPSAAISTGVPYAPADVVTLFFGGFTLADPCNGAGSSRGGHGNDGGDGNHEGRGDESASRNTLTLTTPTPAPLDAAFIVATDSGNPTQQLVIDGPGMHVGSTYVFAPQTSTGQTLRPGHSYTFALAAPPTAAPTPAATEAPCGDHDWSCGDWGEGDR